MARISVIGIGNVLEGDDAIGPTVVRVFEARYAVGEDVTVIDGGTPGLDLTAYMMGLEGLVVVDAIKTRTGTAGEVKVYDKKGILNRGPMVAMSPHEPGLRESILHAEFQGVSPAGHQPHRRGGRLHRVRLPAHPRGPRRHRRRRRGGPRRAAGMGVTAVKRDPPLPPDLWWEKPQPATVSR